MIEMSQKELKFSRSELNITVASLMILTGVLILAIVNSHFSNGSTLHQLPLILKTEWAFLPLHVWTTFEAFITIVVFILSVVFDRSCIYTFLNTSIATAAAPVITVVKDRLVPLTIRIHFLFKLVVLQTITDH